jgi:tRNA(fMet)-specific endonuclease VapC
LIRDRYAVLKIDELTAENYGEIKAFLRKNGTPIPENDIWIAAIAMRFKLQLITRDQHFNHIKNLDLLAW